MVLFAAAWSLIGVTSARAAGTINLSVGPDPAESITTQLGASGTGDGNNDKAVVHVKPAGGQACAANPDADSGSEVVYAYESNPTYTETVNHTFDTAGPYLLCGWLTASNDATKVLAAASLPITVRPPHLALAIASPATVQPDQTFQIVTTAQAETSRTVDEIMVPDTGSGCAANAGAADSASGASDVIFYWSVVGGPLTQTENRTITTPGTYLVCAYFEYPGTDSPPEATAIARTTVVAPPPPPSPCVVPQVGGRVSLASIQQSLRVAHCTPGAIHYAASQNVGQGYVLGLSPGPGTQLNPGATVDVLISTGPPCVVPSFRRGATPGSVQQAIRAAHCSVGRTSAIHSGSVRRGRVVALTPGPHTRLGSGASVRIYVSSGPARR